MGKRWPFINSSRKSLAYLAVLLASALGLAACSPGYATEVVGHPLDPLTEAEYTAVVSALTDAGHVDGAALYPLITLQEPPKDEVLEWNPGDPVPRLAFAIVKKGPDTFEAVVDVLAGEVLSWEQINDVQPGLLPTVEYALVQTIVRGNQGWQSAARERGVEDFGDVVCVPNPVGYFGIEEEEGRRLVKAVCYTPSGADNYWGRPIEGLIALVDLDARELVSLVDTGAVPIPDAPVDLDEASVGALREAPNAISIVQQGGPSFEIDGHQVTWQKWQFHFRTDPVSGPWSRWSVMTTPGSGVRSCIKARCPRSSSRTWIPMSGGSSGPTSTPGRTGSGDWRFHSTPGWTVRPTRCSSTPCSSTIRGRPTPRGTLPVCSSGSLGTLRGVITKR